MMQRWELPAFRRDNLVLTSALRPKPDPKELLVKVEAVSPHPGKWPWRWI
jgi:NADPH:quinone reductase-like Zn-dependent oxidoreductase